MIRIQESLALRLHAMVAEASGGSVGIRDAGLLNSALDSAFAAFGGQEFYPTVEEKAARLGYALISNHAFVDGNKRIGMLIMLTFLEVNGLRLTCSNADVIAAGLGTAAGSMGYEDLLQWVRMHTEPYPQKRK